MTALAEEVAPVVADKPVSEPVSDLDEVLWQAWKAMDLPEGYRAEIIEGTIELSPTGRRRHTVLMGRLHRALDAHLAGSGYAVHRDGNVIHRHKCWIPDLFVAPLDLDEIPDEEGLGVDAAGVKMVVEVTSPGHRNLQRDRARKRREYARAGIPVYVIVDDFDDEGAVVVLTSPDPKKAKYTDEHRVPYGTDAVVPEGPAKGFAIGKAIVAS
ncbi:Uma2 family endonuclease [Streptomyces sp. TRM70350]|uniref:Uma2 family endonuclease n=1 Tax=Streptomyces sp. TRM70350 TaxID=2856165 RepID=UPI001C44E3D7|nr:Uma2 family endonuclease [Streptomyces sp. TRM70350]MBV7697104.1 Uma2 family endonuclease [Streptomyces sp. TRM70350]